MKEKFRKAVRIALFLFLGLFVISLTVEIIRNLNRNYRQNAYYQSDYNTQEQFGAYFSALNKASTKMERQAGEGVPGTVTYEQKYEKVATMSATADKFEEAENSARDIIRDFNAVIQFEKKTGLKPHRYTYLIMGVEPANFDPMVEKLKSVGKVDSFNIDKTDKTSEFISLNTKRKSLEKMRESLIALQQQGGRVEEKMELVTKIHEVDKQIMELGSKLGEYSAENEFCTIKLSLAESSTITVRPAVLEWIRASLEWTIKIYLVIIVLVTLLSAVTLFVVWLLQKTKLIPQPQNTTEGK